MELQQLVEKYQHHPNYRSIIKQLSSQSRQRLLLKGLTGSSSVILSASIVKELPKLNFFILDEKDSAAYFFHDLRNLLPEEQVLFFPSSYKRSVQYRAPENGNIILRTAVLNRLGQFSEGDTPLNIVTYPEAIVEKVANKEKIDDNTLHIHLGEKVSIDFIHEVLSEYGFELVDFVYEPGQYALRGSLVDVFSFTAELPYRIDFFDDEVESIRSFDAETQLSKTKFNKISILPNLETSKHGGQRVSILDTVEKDYYVWSNGLEFCSQRITQIYDSTDFSNNETDKEELLLRGADFLESVNKKTVIELANKSYYNEPTLFEFDTKPQPAFKKNFNLLGDNLKMHLAKEYNTLIFSDNKKQIDRLRAIFMDTHQGIDFEAVNKAIHEGFIDNSMGLCCYTDHQIFDRYHKYRVQSYQSSKAALSLKEIKDLKPGDYVVHIDHGVGRFGGLEKVEQNGKIQEQIKLVYRDNDVLFVSIHSLHRISKYKGKDDKVPKINKLGTAAWQKLKSNTKKKVKDIAKDLIALYAKRKSKKGYSFSSDSYLQEELEASFIYEDTPDQVKATKAVKQDMENQIPMDRLICGDVGFGKTEVAIRAAFKAVSDSKQVAILVPTTILALQHYKTIQERLKNFPGTVDYICRLRKVADQKKTLKKVAEGTVDILIGTHRIIGKDVKFKDLGLLIIDEEQKFGVAAKEKLKGLKVNVDTLTMTATPIPRTLQFSLMGARDLSIINTPPPNRHPIVTELHTFNEEIIAEGINYEVSRGGQVYIIHNRVQNILDVEALINRICPEVKTIVGHGQMEGAKIEQVMIDFMNGDYDVLIATTIIESGLDIPNSNTIFINNAHNFGLSDLHQLRGRVGRSNRKAFCYLLAPPTTMLTPEARRRLKAIEEFSDLGSGFHISLQDLDIRGAGNMLGGEQSGFIADIGFETYNRILDEALQELKENEFKDLFSDKTENAPQTNIKYVNDCTIDTDLEVHLPTEYIENIAERIRLYRELDNIKEEQELLVFKDKLIDRFGELPKSVEDLFQVVRLRWLAIDLGIEKLILKNRKLILFFVSNQESPYYQSPIFTHILNCVQANPRMFKMKEGQNKLTLTIEPIKSLEKTYSTLNNLLPKVTMA